METTANQFLCSLKSGGSEVASESKHKVCTQLLPRQNSHSDELSQNSSYSSKTPEWVCTKYLEQLSDQNMNHCHCSGSAFHCDVLHSEQQLLSTKKKTCIFGYLLA